MSPDILELMTDVRDRVIRIETKMEELPEIKTKVESHERELIKSKAERKVIRGLLYFILITAPAAVAAYVKIFRP